jgi:hypothetical protein
VSQVYTHAFPPASAYGAGSVQYIHTQPNEGAMTEYLEEAFQVAARLPPYQQAELAGRILADVLAAEADEE